MKTFKNLKAETKRLKKNAQARQKRFSKKLVNYLELECCFRDYRIEDRTKYGTLFDQAVHQIVDRESMEEDVENAIYNYQRDGFSNIVFYI